jgi:hypothetical protein
MVNRRRFTEKLCLEKVHRKRSMEKVHRKKPMRKGPPVKLFQIYV